MWRYPHERYPLVSLQRSMGRKSIHSVANLTRDDAREFFARISQFPLHTQVTSYPLEKADQALEDLRHGRFEGAAVITL